MATLNGGGVLVNDHSSLNIIESEFRLNSARGILDLRFMREMYPKLPQRVVCLVKTLGVALEVFC